MSKMPSYGLRNQRALFRKNLLRDYYMYKYIYYKAYFFFPFWNIRIDQPVVFSVHLNSDPMTSPSESSFPFPLPFFQIYTQLFIERELQKLHKGVLVGRRGRSNGLLILIPCKSLYNDHDDKTKTQSIT